MTHQTEEVLKSQLDESAQSVGDLTLKLEKQGSGQLQRIESLEADICEFKKTVAE